MANGMLRKKLDAFRLELGVSKRSYVSDQEAAELKELMNNNQELPAGIVVEKNPNYTMLKEEPYIYHRMEACDLTPDELNEYFQYQKLEKLNTIKNCIVFSTTLLVLSLIYGIIVYFRLSL